MALRGPVGNNTRSLAGNRAAIAALGLAQLPERVSVGAQPITAPELQADIEQAGHFPAGFRAWARHWHFKNRDTGDDHTFASMFAGQEGFASLMASFRCTSCERVYPSRPPACPACGNTSLLLLWIFALKAGKLGFTELECCWDGYVAWSRRNGRVHLFSKEEQAAKQMLTYVLYGLRNLEPAWGVRFVDKEEGGREIPWSRVATQTLHFLVLHQGEERDYGDTRTMQAFATAKNPAIDKVAHHAHVDEWAHMEHPKDVWSSVGTTVSPDGSCHIVTRGAGEDQDVESQWKEAVAGTGKLKAYFAPWTARDGRNQDWLRAETSTLRTVAAISHFAPETPEDAFQGDEANDFVDITWWDACFDETIARFIPDPDGPQQRGDERGRWVGAMAPGDPTPMVLSLDAGVSHDNFAAVAITRHPTRPDDPAIRLQRLWRPEDFEDGIIEFSNVESWVRMICQGGCPLGHPTADPDWFGGRGTKRMVNQVWEPGACPACLAIRAGTDAAVPAFNVIVICYDPFQLADMGQRLKRDGVAWVFAFQQGKPRLEADKTFYDVIVGRRLAHPGYWQMRQHIQATAAKTQKDEESKIRMVKKAPHRPIDLGVAAGMGVERCLFLNL